MYIIRTYCRVTFFLFSIIYARGRSDWPNDYTAYKIIFVT